jgi:hypothetical protein
MATEISSGGKLLIVTDHTLRRLQRRWRGYSSALPKRGIFLV